MKILHVCLGNFYIDKYSYQENLLPKYHKKMGYDVEILASLDTFNEHGEPSYLENECTYYNEHGILVKRISYKSGLFKSIQKKLKRFIGVYEAIENSRPDILFIHGCQFLDIKHIVRYLKKNNKVKVYVDNHADFSNSATNWFSKNIIHRLIWKRCAQLVSPYTTKFYGVLPARVDFLHNIYKIPMQKIELLVMGADDEQVTISKNPYTRNNIRGKYNIGEDDILIVTGGKIDKAKKQTITLMKAIKSLDNEHLKLIVFGSVIEDLKSEFHALIDNDIIHYAGWVSSNESYNYFEASDLVVFPGRHSVFWEQVAGLGKPIIVKYWEGTNHVDLGGNCLFLHEDNEQEIQKVLTNLLENDNKLKEMSRVAEENKSYFSYENISKRAIDI